MVQDIMGMDELNIINSLKYNYNNTINILENNYIDYSLFSNTFKEELKNILLSNGYVARGNNFLVCNSPEAYYASLYNNYRYTKSYIGPQFMLKDKKIALDLLRLDAIESIGDKPTFNKYLTLFSSLEIEELAIKFNIERGSYMTPTFIRSISHVSEDYVELINKYLPNQTITINDTNTYLLENPLVMMQALKTDDPQKIFHYLIELSKQGRIGSGQASVPISDKQYREFKKILKENNYFNIQKATLLEDFNIALASIENGYLTVDDFLNNAFNQRKLGDIHPQNMDRAMKVFAASRDKISDDVYIPFVARGYLSSASLFNLDQEYSRIIKILKNKRRSISPLFIPFDKLSDNAMNKLISDKIISKEQEKLINKITNIREYSFEEEKQALELLNITPSPTSLEQVLNRIKDKKRNDLSFEELNVIQLYGYKLLNAEGINNVTINLFNYFSQIGIKGQYNDKEILISNGENSYVAEMIETMHHEINHAIQFKNIKEMNVSEDSDILDYSKDMVLRQILGESYYNKNYFWMVSEFDAEYKAMIQTEILFNTQEALFAKSLDDFERMKDKTVNYELEFKRDESLLCDLFDEQLRNLYFFNKPRYREIVEMIKEYWPIITYEYDLNTARRKGEFELVKEMASASEKDQQIYKSILENRSMASKVGLDRANDRFRVLNASSIIFSQQECREYIDIRKSKYAKYSEYFSRIMANISKGETAPIPIKDARR